MDIEIPHQELQSKARKRYIQIALVGFAIVGLIWVVRLFIQPTVDFQTLQTSKVVWAPIQASLSATGTVVPEYEQSISSPLQASIDSIYYPAGTKVTKGTPILKLDLSYAKLELEKLEQGPQKKKNEATLIRLKMEKNLSDLMSQYDIKQIAIKRLESELLHEKHLVKVGGGTMDNVKQVELSLQVAKRELQQLKEQISNQQQTNKADMMALSYDINIEEKGVNELRRKMQQAEIRAERDGVIVFVKDKLGSTVKAGEELVRLADLSRFKILATISESYASKLNTAGKVMVKVGDQKLEGAISVIKPEVKNGQIQFEVSLLQNNSPLLRPNLQVDVLVITAFKDKTLVVENGSFFKGKNDQKVFVVRGDKAIMQRIDIGLSNIDSVEVTDLKVGDELILSDMSRYEQADEVQLKNK